MTVSDATEQIVEPDASKRASYEDAPDSQFRAHRCVQLLESHGVKRFVIERIIDRHVLDMLVCLCCFGAGAVAIPVQQYYHGKVEAYWDIAHGRYIGYRCIYQCIDGPSTQELARRLVEYANVRIETTEDCGFRTRGYNEVQWARVDRVYPGAYERALDEAIAWRRRH